MDSNKLKEIRKKIAKAEKIPFIGKILKKYYKKQLFKEIDKIVQSRKKDILCNQNHREEDGPWLKLHATAF